jgi:TolB-like protein/Flp pilus assembly protein TadD
MQERRMSVAPDFATKLGLLLKAHNLSRARLAQTIGIDKSVVSRWASGIQVPTDHNLSLLTQVIAKLRPGFGRFDWDIDVDVFKARLSRNLDIPATASVGEPFGLALPTIPSIAVLPFRNMSDDPEQSYFAEGIVDDIITGLSRVRSIFVIAHSSSSSYKDRIDAREAGRDLGVRYILEGGIRRAGERVRVTTQLVDTTSGCHVWADAYDGQAEEVFELQDQITESVVGILEPTIQQAEIERTRHRRPERFGAYEHYLQSLALTNEFTRESVQKMIEGCLRAISLDPTFAPSYALAARGYVQKFTQGWMVNLARESMEVLDLVERALRADRLDARVLGTAGQCFAWFARDLFKGIAYIDEAIAINPNHSHAFMQSGVVRNMAGDTRTAIDHLNRSLRLSPCDSRSYAVFHGLAMSYLLQAELEKSVHWAQRAVRHNPNYLPGWTALAAAAALTDRHDEARTAAEHILTLQPTFSVSRGRDRYPNAAPQKFQIMTEGLLRAGLPPG